MNTTRRLTDRERRLRKIALKKRILKERMIKTSLLFGSIFGIVLVLFLNVIPVKASAGEEYYKYYTSITVEYGDTLWAIADEHYTIGYDDHEEYIEEVMFINHIPDENDIVSGEVLVIPYYSDEVK